MKAIKALFGVLTAIVLWEMILRQAVAARPGFRNDAVFGRVYEDGSVVHGQEGYSKTIFNNGLRGPAVAPKRLGEYRVLALGDSYTEGLQVADEQTYCRRLEARLAERLHRPVTVINGGRSGASPAYYIHLAPAYMRWLQPDAVVIQLNDEDFTKDALSEGGNFYLKPDGNGYRSVFNAAFVSANPIAQRLPWVASAGNASIVRVASDRIKRLLRGSRDEQSSESELAEDARSTMRAQPHLVAWCVDRLAEAYPKPILLYLPNENRPTSQVAVQLRASANADHLALVDMRRPFDDTARRHAPARGFNNTTFGAGHINSTGHDLVAAKLADLVTARQTEHLRQ